MKKSENMRANKRTHKSMFILLTIVACLLTLPALSTPVLAAEAKKASSPEITKITISTVDDFLFFAENCRLDSYSYNSEVTLQADLDLTGTGFVGIPIFCGTFDGQNHTIEGLELTAPGSKLGFFRYLTETAVVKNLTVKGEVRPGGKKEAIGGIAGHNSGLIRNCSFQGTISGKEYVGGIAGMNTVTGIIEGCDVSGQVGGIHFVGGIAGASEGVIRNCENDAGVNITSQQNTVEIGDITMESLTGTEAAGNTVTDIGGIVGTSSGVIRDCANRGTVGYKHMGYNIGGIAGSQTGYLLDCVNKGAVSGRKDVGGIVGQLQPINEIEYSKDTLQILREQLATLSELTDRAYKNAQNNMNAMSRAVNSLQNHVQNARTALDILILDLPDRENPTLPTIPNIDTLRAAANSLSTSIAGMQKSMRDLSNAMKNMSTNLPRDIQAIYDQIGVMNQTLNNAEEHLGGSITDISDQDTAENHTAKVEGCKNHGSVLADRNIGGIVGTMSFENDLDPEDDVTFYGEESLNFASEVRAVVLDCENSAPLTATKQNAGGIVGLMPFGLVKQCVNTGDLECENADYVGGIAGRSHGYIRWSNTKCVVSGSEYVGGVAGFGKTVSDCLAMNQITGSENLGAILGDTDSLGGIIGNRYLIVESDIGAIDGVSYNTVAQPMVREIAELPEIFKTIQVTFAFEDGTQTYIAVPLGTKFSEIKIPEIPEKAGYSAHWEGLGSSEIFFDTQIQAVYVSLASVIQSEEKDETGKPILLAEGSFADGAFIELLQKEGALEYRLDGLEGTAQIHYLIPDDYSKGQVFVNGAPADFHVDGSYFVFSASEQGEITIVQEEAKVDLRIYAAIAAAGVAVIVLILVCVMKRKKKQKIQDNER